MKKFVIRKNIVLTVLSGVVLCLMLAACKNFLNAGKVKEEIEHSIYVNNHECPVATVEEPVFSDSGVAWNKTIIITFSLPIDPDTFIDSYNIKDSDGKSVLDNYTEPEWFNNNTKVVIYANELNPLVIPEGKTKDFYITLSKKCTTEDGLPIKTAINHKYRLNSVNENVPPVMASTTNVKRPSVKYNDSIISNPVTFVEGELDAQNETTICKTNHIKSDLEFYVEGSDFGGAKVNAYITYSRVNDIGGSKIESPKEEKIIEELKNKNIDGNYYQTIPFSFNSDSPDGMYKFTICIEDQYHGYSEEKQVYYIIRDTNMAKSSNALIWFESPNFRQDFTIDRETIYPAPFDAMVPTGEKIDAIRKSVQFQFILDDTYYISSFDNTKVYSDKLNTYTYLFSWGTSLDNLTPPVPALSVTETDIVEYYGYTDPGAKVPLEHPKDENGNVISNAWTYDSWYNNWFNDTYRTINVNDVRSMSSTKIIYTLPLEYEVYVQSHPNSDIFLQATVIDSVGNANTVTTLSPKKPKFYGYKVEDGENESKKITLSYSDYTGADLTSLVNIPDKLCIENYRIFIAELPKGYNEKNTDSLNLRRTTVKRWVEDQYSGITDSNIFNIPKNKDGSYSKYVVYIQPNYSTNSVLSGKWTGQTFGPYYKVIIDPAQGSAGWVNSDPSLPDSITISKIERKSAGPSTGLLNVTVTLNAPDERYVPCYQTIDTAPGWIYPDFTISEDKKHIYFTMVNPLRAPTKKVDGTDHPWRRIEGTWENGDPKYIFRDDFWESIERIKDRDWFNYNYNVRIKVQITGGNEIVESVVSDATTLMLTNYEDDNIPPYQNHKITTHDSMLSSDGHSFEFRDLIVDDQASLVKTFKYYYTTYNEAWGDNLSVLSEEEIRSLPYGISKLKSNCYVDKDWDYPKDERTDTDRIVIQFTPVVPIKGLADGKYMFFGEFSDTYGNTCIIPLGKADIGTFKNKPEVDWSIDQENGGGDTITIDFTRNGDEYFENYYAYVEILDGSTGNWNSLFDGYSTLQKLNFTGSKASLKIDCNSPNYRDWDNDNKTFYQGISGTGFTLGEKHGDWENGTFKAKHLPRWTYYKVTVQGFNTHPYDSATNKGVNKYYEMPYKDYDPAADNSNWTPWDGEYSGYVNGETEYDLCTEETSSCSSYMYFPGYEIEDNGEINYTEAKYDLSDIRYSFSPSDATIHSNIKYLVNVYTSIIDLGNDIDAWERKGKLIKSHFYEPRSTPTRWDLEDKGEVSLNDIPKHMHKDLQNAWKERWDENDVKYKKEFVYKKFEYKGEVSLDDIPEQLRANLENDGDVVWDENNIFYRKESSAYKKYEDKGEVSLDDIPEQLRDDLENDGDEVSDENNIKFRKEVGYKKYHKENEGWVYKENVSLDNIPGYLRVSLVNVGDEAIGENYIMYRKEGNVYKKYKNVESYNEYYHEENDPSVNPFSFNKAMDDLYNSEETGFMYYTCVIHFADNNSVISDVRSIYCK